MVAAIAAPPGVPNTADIPGTLNARIMTSSISICPSPFTSIAFIADSLANSIFSTAVITLTNKRLLIGRKRVVFGYFLDSITPEMFNDLKVLSGVIWGKIHIDTVNELVTLSNIDKSALPEIETMITSYMMREKQKLHSIKG